MRLFLLLSLVLSFGACTRPVTPTAAENPDVVVVGGGLAGLSAAYSLQKSGLRVHLLQERPVLGGRVGTAYCENGLHDEYGMQEVWENNPLLQLARKLRVPLDTPEAAFSSVLVDNRIRPYHPNQTPAYFDTLLGTEDALRLRAWLEQAEKLAAQARRVGLQDPDVQALQDESFATWVQTSGLLAPRAQAWLRLTIECEMAADWQDFSALSALLEMDTVFGAGMPNYHVQGGNQRLIEALGKALPGPISLGASVNALIRRPTPAGDVQVSVRYEKDHQIKTLTAKRVVLAIPFVRLHQLYIDPLLPTKYWMGINSLALGQYVVIHLQTAPAARALYDADVFPVLAGGPLGVLYGTTHTENTGAQDLFGLLIYGDAAKRFHMVPRESKVQEIKEGLHALWPGLGAQVRDAHVYSYYPAALPVWPPGRSALDSYAHTLRTPHQGLHLAGDYTRGAHATGAVQPAMGHVARMQTQHGRHAYVASSSCRSLRQ